VFIAAPVGLNLGIAPRVVEQCLEVRGRRRVATGRSIAYAKVEVLGRGLLLADWEFLRSA
jgi:hypothetical protein